MARSLRAEIRAAGIRLDPDAELRDCDQVVKCVAYGIANRRLTTPLPGMLLEALETFDDLVHYANLRNAQEDRGEVWTG